MAHSVKCHATRTGWTEPFSVAVTGNPMSDFCDHSSPQKPSLTWGWPWVTQLGCARGWANPLCSCQLWGRWNTDFINGKLGLKWHNWEYKSGIREGDGKLMLWRRRSPSLFFLCPFLFVPFQQDPGVGDSCAAPVSPVRGLRMHLQVGGCVFNCVFVKPFDMGKLTLISSC